VKLPDSVKVPGEGPAAVPLTEKLKLPPLPTVQVPVNVDLLPLAVVKVSPASENGMAACASTAPSPSAPRIRHPVSSSKRRARRALALQTTGLTTFSLSLSESRDPKQSRKPPTAPMANHKPRACRPANSTQARVGALIEQRKPAPAGSSSTATRPYAPYI
jgi:hypothetical protein